MCASKRQFTTISPTSIICIKRHAKIWTTLVCERAQRRRALCCMFRMRTLLQLCMTDKLIHWYCLLHFIYNIVLYTLRTQAGDHCQNRLFIFWVRTRLRTSYPLYVVYTGYVWLFDYIILYYIYMHYIY